jgi:hypothetical protein
MTESGKVGEPGVRGDIGEWRAWAGGGLPLALLKSGESVGDLGGGFAFLGGRTKD